ncbi:hypothetical protein [Desertivirga arenae]|uniref:hypothetical protein n=1 Tax=Desertivirga arenae TaxID=2810309 RepID=UPI001A966BB2|nr:hypothetical protein [Pedobacter sp. SYSU D00823]
MNYILHLNGFFKKANADPRMTAYHISLYMAIFQLWNAVHFKNLFYVNRQELMELSKIGSTTTYHHHLKDLDTWKYIQYFPSKNISLGSRIRCLTFTTSSRTSKATCDDTNAEASGVLRLVSSNKQVETVENCTNTFSLKIIKKFFEDNGSSSREAKKFFDYYQAQDWKINHEPISNWEAPALSWIARQKEFSKKSGRKSVPSAKRTLKLESTTQTKQYDEPL